MRRFRVGWHQPRATCSASVWLGAAATPYTPSCAHQSARLAASSASSATAVALRSPLGGAKLPSATFRSARCMAAGYCTQRAWRAGAAARRCYAQLKEGRRVQRQRGCSHPSLAQAGHGGERVQAGRRAGAAPPWCRRPRAPRRRCRRSRPCCSRWPSCPARPCWPRPLQRGGAQGGNGQALPARSLFTDIFADETFGCRARAMHAGPCQAQAAPKHGRAPAAFSCSTTGPRLSTTPCGQPWGHSADM